jgi:hypothetical protein
MMNCVEFKVIMSFQNQRYPCPWVVIRSKSCYGIDFRARAFFFLPGERFGPGPASRTCTDGSFRHTHLVAFLFQPSLSEPIREPRGRLINVARE